VADGEMNVNELMEKVNAGMFAGESVFSKEEFDAGLQELQDKNKILVVEDTGIVVNMSG